ESVVRLVGAFLMEFDEKWTSGCKYLDMTEYLALSKEHFKKSQKVIRICN
ncbi:MAG: IS256 family transposase, partial [Syntrophomonadaceae bacterium]|nr:IS256 family transposase [Syntrophomonadaceae bacterium]